MKLTGRCASLFEPALFAVPCSVFPGAVFAFRTDMSYEITTLELFGCIASCMILLQRFKKRTQGVILHVLPT